MTNDVVGLALGKGNSNLEPVRKAARDRVAHAKLPYKYHSRGVLLSFACVGSGLGESGREYIRYVDVASEKLLSWS